MNTQAANPEINLGFGARPHGVAASLFSSYVAVVGADDNSDIQQSWYQADTGFTASGLGNKESWSNSRLTLSGGFSPQTKSNCAVAIQSSPAAQIATPARSHVSTILRL